MIVEILVILFLVWRLLGGWVERRHDVLHAPYVTKSRGARARIPADLSPQSLLTKLSRIVRYAEGESEMSTARLQELEELG
jgi:hypothetical protein